MERWMVLVVGNGDNLAYLTERMRKARTRIIRDGDKFFLVASDFERMTDAAEVSQHAEELVEYLNAIARISVGLPSVIGRRHVVRIADDGTRQNYYTGVVDVMPGRFRVSATGIVTGPNGESGAFIGPPGFTFEEQIAELAGNDAYIREVLAAYAENPSTWGSLYKVYEAIMKDMKGDKVLVQRGWVASMRELEDFTYTASHSAVGGKTARHITARGYLKAKSARPMSIREAQRLIDNLIERWFYALL